MSPDPTRARMRRGATWFLAWLAASLVSVGLFERHRSTPVDPDEIYWIGSAYYYHLAFTERDWNHPDWKLMSARENPPVSKYVMGMGLAVAGQHIVDRDMLGCFVLMFKDPAKWGEGAYYERRAADIGRMTTESCARPLGGPGVTNKPALLLYARRTLLVTMIVASLLVFFIGASIANAATGFIASQLLLLHPITIYTYNHAMADSVALLFSAAAALTMWHLIRRLLSPQPISTRTVAPFAVATALMLALACGAKMNALIMVFVFVLAMAGIAFAAWRRNDRARALQVMSYGSATGVLAFLAFITINPAVLADFSTIRALFEEQRIGIEYSMRAMPELRLQGLDDRFGAVSHVATGPLTFVLGAIVCLVPALRSGRKRPGLWLVAAWWITAVIVVTAWIPIAWARYVLPIVAPSALLLAYALTNGFEAAKVLARRRWPLARETA